MNIKHVKVYSTAAFLLGQYDTMCMCSRVARPTHQNMYHQKKPKLMGV